MVVSVPRETGKYVGWDRGARQAARGDGILGASGVCASELPVLRFGLAGDRKFLGV